MNTIIERDKQIEAKAGRYYLLRRIFLVGIIIFAIALMSTIFIRDRIPNAEDAEMAGIWGIFICFVIYKWASVRVQHIETIRFYNKGKEEASESNS